MCDVMFSGCFGNSWRVVRLVPSGILDQDRILKLDDACSVQPRGIFVLSKNKQNIVRHCAWNRFDAFSPCKNASCKARNVLLAQSKDWLPINLAQLPCTVPVIVLDLRPWSNDIKCLAQTIAESSLAPSTPLSRSQPQTLAMSSLRSGGKLHAVPQRLTWGETAIKLAIKPRKKLN